MSERKTTLSHLDEVEGQILRLVPLQKQLRDKAEKRYQKDREDNPQFTLNEFATRCGGTWKDAEDFLKRDRAMATGRFFTGLALYLAEEELCEEIERIARGLNDRELSVSLFPEPVVRTTFRIRKAHVRRQDRVTRALFAGVFKPYDRTVLKIFDLSHEALKELCDETTRKAIELLLENENVLDAELEAQLDVQNKRIGELTRILERLTQSLLHRYHGQYTKLAEALSVPKTTFQEARFGRASEKMMIQIIEKARQLATSHGISESGKLVERERREEAHAVHQPTPAPPSRPTEKQGENHDWHSRAGGIPSPDGVLYCITADQLDSLALEHVEGFIAWAKQAIQMARFAMNICTKVRDEATRTKVRNALKGESRELYLSLQVVEGEYPSEIAPIMDAQRLSFLAKPGKNSS